VTANLPAFTTIPPRIHHKKTTFYQPLFTKTPEKTDKSPAGKKPTKIIGF
jgi:hypothetical protein